MPAALLTATFSGHPPMPFRKACLFLGAALLCLHAAPAAAQERPVPQGITLDEMVDLLRSQVSSARVLVLARERCIHFEPDDLALARLGDAGATRELLDGLRAPTLCNTARRAVQPAPPTDRPPARRPEAPPQAPPPAPAEAPVRWGRGFFVGAGYAAGGYEPDGEDIEMGHGLAVELGYAFTPNLAVVGHGTYDRVARSGGYDLMHGDIVARAYLAGRRAPARFYLDAGFGTVTMARGEIGETVERSGEGFAAAAGVQVALSPSTSLDLSARALFAGLTSDEGAAGVDAGAVSGRSGRLYVGLSWRQ